MSHHSGFSSASRMEIDRLNEVAAIKDAKTAAEMAAKDEKLAALQAMLMASGILGGVSMSQPPPQTHPQPSTPGGRKRHNSQQLGNQSKGGRTWDEFPKLSDAAIDHVNRNRFEPLTRPDSFMDDDESFMDPYLPIREQRPLASSTQRALQVHSSNPDTSASLSN